MYLNGISCLGKKYQTNGITDDRKCERAKKKNKLWVKEFNAELSRQKAMCRAWEQGDDGRLAKLEREQELAEIRLEDSLLNEDRAYYNCLVDRIKKDNQEYHRWLGAPIRCGL